jgi:phosphoesterase RecJ-like protein
LCDGHREWDNDRKTGSKHICNQVLPEWQFFYLYPLFQKMKINLSESCKNIKQLFEKNSMITIVAHSNPDGDAIGSCIGLYHILAGAGKNVRVITPNDFPEFLQWIEGCGPVMNYEKQKKEATERILGSDLIVCLDFNGPSRAAKLGELLKESKGTKVMIDHHPDPEPFCDLIISDISVSSTAELVFEVIDHCGFRPYLEIKGATALFTGIMTDTLSFTVNCSHPRTFEVASALLEYGVDKEMVQKKVFNNFSAQRMQLLGHALVNKMVILPEFGTGFISLSQEELKKFNFQPGDSEGFVNYPLSIKGIFFSALFLEKRDHIKISFRSSGNLPVNEIMGTHFTGGGHKNAAGGEWRGMTLEETIHKFREVLPLYESVIQKELKS